MFYKRDFISGCFSDDFIQVGLHDEEELVKSGCSNDINVSVEMDALRCLQYFPHVQNLILKPGLIAIDELSYLYHLPLKRLKLDYYNDTICEYSIDLGRFSCLEHVSAKSKIY